jgi:catechol 2,3-dioxygenase-like lactoylglutathione lyase family enzyme
MPFDGLRRIGQIHVSVSDLERSVAFYRDRLGIPLLFEVRDANAARLVSHTRPQPRALTQSA